MQQTHIIALWCVAVAVEIAQCTKLLSIVYVCMYWILYGLKCAGSYTVYVQDYCCGWYTCISSAIVLMFILYTGNGPGDEASAT